jgi:hypothetical protein
MDIGEWNYEIKLDVHLAAGDFFVGKMTVTRLLKYHNHEIKKNGMHLLALILGFGGWNFAGDKSSGSSVRDLRC